MAMITGFLLAYALLTAPFIGAGIWRAHKARREKPATLDDIYTPKTIYNVIIETGKVAEGWLSAIRDGQLDLKRDNQAMLQVTKAMAQSMLDIKVAAERLSAAPVKEKSVEEFVQGLEYVRDRYAKTPGQRKVVETIITNIRTSHGNA